MRTATVSVFGKTTPSIRAIGRVHSHRTMEKFSSKVIATNYWETMVVRLLCPLLKEIGRSGRYQKGHAQMEMPTAKVGKNTSKVIATNY
jgi:hypothetical protein